MSPAFMSRQKSIQGMENMLVLSRREGQTIRLPGLDIEISVLKTQGGRVQIGIEAPREISIQRGERVLDEESLAVPGLPDGPTSVGGLGQASTRTRPSNPAANIVRSTAESYWVSTA